MAEEIPSWVKEWAEETEPLVDEGKDWIKSRPKGVKLVMQEFPPSSVVRLLRSCCHLRKGTLAVIRVYYEEHGIMLGVTDGLDGSSVHRVELDDVEYVSCWNGLTPEKMQEILSET